MSDSIEVREGALSGLSFIPMTRALAEQIIEWRYPEYPLFNVAPEEAEAEIGVLLEPAYRYHVALDAAGEAVGFCCFGEDARVPGGDYEWEEALDVGLGLRPDLTGKGLGLPFLQAILEFGKAQFAPKWFRATIAVFNVRSRRIFERAGFRLRQTFYSGGMRPLAFVILVKEAD